MDYVRRYKKMNLFTTEKKDNNISKFPRLELQTDFDLNLSQDSFHLVTTSL